MATDALYQNHFRYPAEHYTRDLNLFKQYVDQAALFLHTSTGRPIEACAEFVKKSLRKGGKFEFKDPVVDYLVRKDNGDRERRETTLSRYINESIRDNDVIAPTFTTYVSPKIRESLLSKYIRVNMASRSLAKKAMFKAKADKNLLLEQVKETEQKGKKTSNNSLSGAHISKSTPLRNKTAHSTLTSTCRTTSGYGNANNEKFVSGNRHYHNYSVTLSNIVAITAIVDYAKLEAIMTKYDLHYPTAEEVVQCITYSSESYWYDRKAVSRITEYVKKMTPLQCAAFVYTGDFYHLRKHNQEFVKKFLTRLSDKVTGEHPDPLATLKKAPENYINLAHQICRHETKGIGKDYGKITNPADVSTIALTVDNIAHCVLDYSDLIDALWMTKCMPASVSYFPNSIRRTALTSDTDSTIFTTQDWVIWYNGKLGFDDRSHSIYCAVVFLASATIAHLLAIMSANLGVVTDRLFDIKMKSEFSFDVFVPTNLGKHYFAAISCREGQVYEEFEWEVKGMNLKSSNTPSEVIESGNKMMQDIIHDVVDKQSISLFSYLRRVADIEQDIANTIKSGGLKYYRTSSIKDAGSYAGEPENSPYRNHYLWQEVFAAKYGDVQLPPYSTVKISVDTDTTTKYKEWLSSIEDKDFVARLEAYMAKNEKNTITTYNLPYDIVSARGIPPEVLKAVNYLKIVKDICKIYYIVLETLGFFTKSTVSEAIGLPI